MIVKLPAKHARDWFARCGEALDARIVDETARTVALDLPPLALRDLISDAEYYAECMHGEWAGGTDYRPAARRCLAALERAGARR